MLRKLALPVLALLAVPAIASAQFEAGNYEVTLSGSASAPRSATALQAGAQGSLGYFVTKELEVSVRQSVTYLSDTNTGPGVPNNFWGGSTLGAMDYHFDLGAFQPFVGAFGGYEYPGAGHSFAAVGPEAGLKYFVNGTTFVFMSVGYEYALNKPAQNSFFTSTLGVGFKF